jgi:PAS domain-containing protein
LALVLRGFENKQIGTELGLAEQSVKGHVSTLLGKFVVPNRAALADAGAQLDFTGEVGLDRAWIRQMFREAQPSIAILRGPEFRYEAVNETFERYIGGRSVVGRTMREAFPELEGQGYFEAVERTFRTGEPWLAHEVQRQLDRGQGIEQRAFDTAIQPLRGDDGTINGVITFSLDVTDLVRERRRGELLSAEIAAVLDLVPSGVVVVDSGGYIVKVNAAARRMAGTAFDQSRPIDEQAHEVCNGRDASGKRIELMDMPLSRALRGLPTEEVEFSFTPGEPATPIRLSASVQPLRDPGGQILGAIAVFTER